MEQFTETELQTINATLKEILIDAEQDKKESIKRNDPANLKATNDDILLLNKMIRHFDSFSFS